jgi:hypothetical protein
MIFSSVAEKGGRYLHGSYCLTEDPKGNRFIALIQEEGGNEVSIHRLDEKGGLKRNLIRGTGLNKYSFSTPPLGYLPGPYPGETRWWSYIQRIPRRAWKVGVTSRNVNDNTIMMRDVEGCLWSLSHRLYRDYPSFQDCIRQDKSGKGDAFAFSKNYAIRNKHLIYKGKYTSPVVNVMGQKYIEVSDPRLAAFHRDNLNQLTGELEVRLRARTEINPLEDDV